MASLTGQLVAETYKALLKTIDNDILTASEKQITDGLGGGSNVFIDSQGFLRAYKYKVTNGLATQFLKADGSLDSNTYLTGITSSQIITALGYTPVPTTRTLTINGTTYDLSANRSWTVAGTAAIWGNITGTLSNQTDLQTALNAKFNNPTGTISQYIRGDGTLATFPTLPGGLPTGGTAGQILAKIDATDYNAQWIDNYATQTKNEVKLGATLAKGTAVYVSGSTGGSGTNMIVMAASNASEALSSKTFGLLETGGATNDFVKCVTFGLIAGLDTSTATAGDPVWLGVNGALLFGLANKPVAPANMVYIGVVKRVQSNNGEIFVNVQNGFEIEELHDVLITSKANNQGLFYESSTGLWKNKSIATLLGYTPQAQLNGTGFVKASGTTISYDNSTYLTTADAASTYQLLTNLSTDLTASATKYPSVNAVIAGLATKQNQLNGTGLVRMDGTTVSYDNNTYLTGSGSVGYITSWNATTGLTNSSLFESSGSIGLNITNVNYSAYGRAFTGASFAASSFGYEIASGATADGGLLGGLAYVLISNDASRRIGAKIESNVVGTTATNLGANLRFYVKADNAAIAEIARMTASGVTFYSGITATSFVKTGGTSNEYLRADGSVNVITGDIISGSGTAGYIAKFGSSAVIASSNLYESAANIGFGTITLNYGSYGRAFTGAGFGSTSFGFEAVTGSTTNGGLIGGLSLVIAGNDSTRRIGSAIQSYISGATSTHQGADLRFFVKPDNGVLLEVVRMTSAGITFNKDLTAANINATTFVKSGGTASEFLMADGSVSTLSSPVTGSGSAGYIPKWTTAANIGSSIIYEDISIGIAYTTPNRGGYGRTLSGAAFGSASFGFEAVSNTTTNGGLIGGLSFIVNQNDSSRIVGSAIQSNLVGTTATNYGADLRFFAKADGVFTIAEVARMTSAGLRVYGTIVKDGGTASQVLMADGSVAALPNLAGYVPYSGATSTVDLGNQSLSGSIISVQAVTSLTDKATLRTIGSADPNWGFNTTSAAGAGSNQYHVRALGFGGSNGVLRQFQVVNSETSNTVNFAVNFDGTGAIFRSGLGLGGVMPTTDRQFLISGTSFTTGTSQYQAVINTTFVNAATEIHGLYLQNNTNVNVSNSYAINIAPTGGIGSVTNKWAIYQNGASDNNYFAGKILINTTTDAGYLLDVNGWARVKGSFVVGDASAAGLFSVTPNSIGTRKVVLFSGGDNNFQFYGFGVESSTLVYSTYTTGDDHVFFAGTGTASRAELARIKGTGGASFNGSVTASNYYAPSNTGFWSDSFDVRRNGFVNNGTNLIFRAGNSTTGEQTRMVIVQETGNVGINTSTVNIGKLEVVGPIPTFFTADSQASSSTYGGSIFYRNHTGVGQGNGLTFSLNNASSARAEYAYIGGVIETNAAGSHNGAIIFAPSLNGNRTEQVRITNLGTAIGTTSPILTASDRGNLTINGSGASILTLASAGSFNTYIYSTSSFSEVYSAPKLWISVNGSIRASFETNGNVLINSTSDNGNRFQVTGTIWSSGINYAANFYAGGTYNAPNAVVIASDLNWTFGCFNSGAEYWMQVKYYGENNDSRGFRVFNVNGNTIDFRVNGLGNGIFRGSVTATSFFESSDFRLKTLIEHNPIIDGIENLQAKLYEKDGKIELGYFAQDAEKIMPYAVTKNADGFLNLSYREVHTAKIARLEQRVAELEKQLNLN